MSIGMFLLYLHSNNQKDMNSELLKYDMGVGVEAFSTRRDSVLPYPVIQPHQTHSTSVVVVDRPDYCRDALYGVDALVTNLPGVAIGVRTADCIPVLLYDPVNKAVGAAHSGWRGSVNKISAQTVLAMIRNFGSKPADIRAVIGPGIGPDSFQVGEDVARLFKESGFPVEKIWSFRGPCMKGSMAGGHHIDLWEVCRITLCDCGLLASNIQVTGICTYEHPEFYSARREGQSCGRIISSIRLL